MFGVVDFYLTVNNSVTFSGKRQMLGEFFVAPIILTEYKELSTYIFL